MKPLFMTRSLESYAFPLTLLCLLLTSGCGTKKPESLKKLYGPVWELETLPGSETAMDELFPDMLPRLQFDPQSSTVSGNSGCNGFSASFEIDGGRLEFGPAGPSTLMYCGEGELLFRKALERVDSWNIPANGKLLLKNKAKVLMEFRRSAVE